MIRRWFQTATKIIIDKRESFDELRVANSQRYMSRCTSTLQTNLIAKPDKTNLKIFEYEVWWKSSGHTGPSEKRLALLSKVIHDLLSWITAVLVNILFRFWRFNLWQGHDLMLFKYSSFLIILFTIVPKRQQIPETQISRYITSKKTLWKFTFSHSVEEQFLQTFVHEKLLTNSLSW